MFRGRYSKNILVFFSVHSIYWRRFVCGGRTRDLLSLWVAHTKNGIAVLCRSSTTSSGLPICTSDSHVPDAIVVMLILSRLNLGNVVLVGIPANLLRQLQSVWKSSARLIFHLKRYDNASDALISLHWQMIITICWDALPHQSLTLHLRNLMHF